MKPRISLQTSQILKDYYKNATNNCLHTFNNLVEMGQFLENQKSSQFIQYKISNLNNTTSTQKI